LAFVDASATLVYSTVADNRAPVGSNIDLSAATSLTTVASVIQAVDASSPNCALDGTSSVLTQGYNFADDTSCALTDPTDRQGTANDPELGALAGNGGPTETMLPAPTSPLVDAIPTGSCQIGDAAGIATDQRGDSRPGAPDTNCDIGAAELFTDIPIAPPPVPARLQPRFTG
jgi:hypothetical protein